MECCQCQHERQKYLKQIYGESRGAAGFLRAEPAPERGSRAQPYLVSAEEGAGLGAADLAHGVLQVRVNLDLREKRVVGTSKPPPVPLLAGRAVGHHPPPSPQGGGAHPSCTDPPPHTAPLTFFVNLVVLISTKAAVTAFR